MSPASSAGSSLGPLCDADAPAVSPVVVVDEEEGPRGAAARCPLCNRHRQSILLFHITLKKILLRWPAAATGAMAFVVQLLHHIEGDCIVTFSTMLL